MAQLRILVELDTDGATLDDLYLAKGVLGMIDQGYQNDGGETPEWIADKLTAVNTEIISRTRAELQRRLKLARARRDALKGREERRTELDAEIAKLEEKLK